MAVSAQPTRVRRVFIALVLAGVLIFGAYLLANPNFFAASTANAESTQALLAAYAQKKGPDGLPLWEDQLIATASSTAWSNVASTTDVDTTPAPGITPASGTLTDQFAQNLFSQYMDQEGGANPSDQDIDTFAQDSIQTLVQNHVQQNVYSEANVTVSGTGAVALKAYADAQVEVAKEYTIPTTESELDYFSDAVTKNQPDELKEVAAIGAAYSALAPAFVAVPVPAEAQQAHLEIANAMARLGPDITDMSAMETDPLRAYLGLSAYQTDAASLTQGYADMASVFAADDAILSPQDSGYYFYDTALLAANAASPATSSPQ